MSIPKPTLQITSIVSCPKSTSTEIGVLPTEIFSSKMPTTSSASPLMMPWKLRRKDIEKECLKALRRSCQCGPVSMLNILGGVNDFIPRLNFIKIKINWLMDN